MQRRIQPILARYQKKIATAINSGRTTDVALQGLFDELRAALGPELAGIMTQRSLELTAETGITSDAAVISEEALGWARDYNYQLVTGLTDTTRKLVQQSVGTFVETPGMTRGDLEKLLSPAFGEHRASMIAVTEVTRAYSEATNQHQRLIRDEVGLEMRRRWDTLRDELVCPICGPKNGLPEEDWQAEFPNGPPAHPNCILPGNVIAVPGLSAGAKSFYDGIAVEIQTGGGRSVTVTQNHPILTSAGWMKAKAIHEGVDVIVCTRPERIATSVYPDYEHSPALVEEVFRALEMSRFVSTTSMPAAAEYLHGDGRFVDGYIQVVRPNSELLGEIKAMFSEALSQFGFSGYDPEALSLSRDSTQTFLFPGDDAATSRIMGSSDLILTLPCGHLLPLEPFRFGLATGGDASFEEKAANDRARKAVLVSQFLLRYAADITLDNVISVRDFQFHGHVYDLQSEIYGLYTSNGIVSSNCRCSTSLTMDDAETVRAEAIAKQTAREKLLREQVAGEKPGAAPLIVGPTAKDMRKQVDEVSYAGEKEHAELMQERIPVNKEIRELSEKRADAAIGGDWEAMDRYDGQLAALRVKQARLSTRMAEVKQRTRQQARELLYIDNPAEFEAKRSWNFSAERKAAYDRGIEETRRLIGTGTVDDALVYVEPTRSGRSWQGGKMINMATAAREKSTIHEMGHWLEEQDSEVHRKALEFYDRRTAGEKATWLGDAYDKDEITRRDKFLDPYMGKDYGRGTTEIVSMGIEHYWDDAAILARDDPDYFDFIFDLLRGQ